jgi:hypothetical protein
MMGTVIHMAFVVTSWNRELLAKAYDFAASDADIGPLVSPIIESTINSYWSFFIAPDGSKLGWGHREAADEGRRRVTEWIQAQAYEDGGNSLEWCCVPFGNDMEP